MGKVALIFPGQGSQRVGMGREAYEAYSTVRDVFNEASDILGLDLATICFKGPQEMLTLTENAQPAILTLSVALFRILKEKGIKVDMVAGHSLGEFSALVAAEGLPFEHAVETVRLRGRYMQEAVPPGKGAMAAIIGMESKAVEGLCEEFSTFGVVEVANYNSPEQTVISGERGAVEMAAEAARGRGAKKAILLEVSAPFHCSLMVPARERLRPVLESLPFSPLGIPLISNVTAQAITDGEMERGLLVEQVTSPVRWAQSIQFAIDQGVQIFVEVGPGTVLTGLVRRIARDTKAVSFSGPVGIGRLEGLGVF